MAKIDTENARKKLPVQREPHWDRLSLGVYLGFRKTLEGGTWIGRRPGEGGKKYAFQSFGDIAGMTYEDARAAVERWSKAPSNPIPVSEGPNVKKWTVSDACRAYVAWLAEKKGPKSAHDAAKRFRAYIYPETATLEKGTRLASGRKKRSEKFSLPIGDIRFLSLHQEHVKAWLKALIAHADPSDAEETRKAKDSANRILKSFKAACNYVQAEYDDFAETGRAWEVVKAYEDVGRRREIYLDPETENRLMSEMPEPLHRFATSLLMIGARPGELANAKVQDFNPHTGEMFVTGKTKGRKFVLYGADREYFANLVKARPGDAPLLCMENGKAWTTARWVEQFREAREKAGIDESVMYAFRHTFITRAIKGGQDLLTVARKTGTSLQMIDEHYGHLVE